MTKNASLGSLPDWMDDDAAFEAGPDAAGDVVAHMGGLDTIGRDRLLLTPRSDIYEDDEPRSIQSRALASMRAGVPVHLRGPAGTGKTTLALDIAARLGRPVAEVTGDHAMTSADLVGREIGSSERHAHDRYVHRVTRRESATRADWADSILTRAPSQGWTLVHDEFARAPAIANNALLSALEERVLVISNPVRGTRHVRAHPEFRAVFTSNPADYSGVAEAPDALADRMITFDLGWRSADTEAGGFEKIAVPSLRITASDFAAARAVTHPSVLRETHVEIPEGRRSDIGRLSEAKEALTEPVIRPQTHDRMIAELGMRPPAGVRLAGPPGGGKTMLARALAAESRVNVILGLAALLTGKAKRRMAERMAVRQRPLERLRERGDVLPARPGQSLPVERLRPAIAANAEALAAALATIAGRARYQLTLRWRPAAALRRFAQEPEPAGLAEPQALARGADALRARLGAAMAARLAACTLGHIFLPLDPGPEMLTNLVVLTPRGGSAALDAELEAIDAIWSEGLSIRIIGPLPAVSFASFELAPPAGLRARSREAADGAALTGAADLLRRLARAQAAATGHPGFGDARPLARFLRDGDVAARIAGPSADRQEIAA